MVELVDFNQYVQAGVHELVRANSATKERAATKTRVSKAMRLIGGRREKWLQTLRVPPT